MNMIELTLYVYFYYSNFYHSANDIICILFQLIKEDVSKFDRIKDVDEDPGTSTLLTRSLNP